MKPSRLSDEWSERDEDGWPVAVTTHLPDLVVRLLRAVNEGWAREWGEAFPGEEWPGLRAAKRKLADQAERAGFIYRARAIRFTLTR